ncbi:MAG: protocatechuate 3,4-dioxygenase subunit alpha [Acidobacteria bacterium]|nr:protocatechuate 3,4-dioxygenase subunit alpha [Acidobacteriota bacterium]MYJ03438.1 protocatechuate 3,4-dioxygenase subunit alpha [Acidobacteriota bacterium]
MLALTPFQTVGPFFAILVPEQGRLTLAGADVPGERIVIEATVHDGASQPVPDALIEIWQANAAGCYNHPDDARCTGPDPAFGGFGRVRTDGAGGFSLKTIKPGPVPGPDGQPQAPHLLVGLFARGLLSRLVTRIYFSDEPANGDDPILAAVAPDRRPTLVAARRDDGRYTHTITLQGPGETVFFDV